MATDSNCECQQCDILPSSCFGWFIALSAGAAGSSFFELNFWWFSLIAGCAQPILGAHPNLFRTLSCWQTLTFRDL
jgi:hypothetical protein